MRQLEGKDIEIHGRSRCTTIVPEIIMERVKQLNDEAARIPRYL